MNAPKLDLLHPFPLPPDAPASLREELASRGQAVKLVTGSHYLRQNTEVKTFALVSEGLLRVYRTGETGREITLYTVGPGECCMINVLCLLSGRRSPAYAQVEQEVHALAYPRELFLRWMAEDEFMRTFVNGMLADRIGSMMALIEEVAFQRMDRRLGTYLLERTERFGDPQLQTTHETVAADLGTVREVVSRLLKDFERRGFLELGRGSITLTDPGALQHL